MANKPISHFTAGIVTTIIGIVLFFVYYYTGMSFVTNFISMVPYIVTVVLLVLFVLMYGRARHNQVTYGDLFSYGFRSTMIFSLLMVAFIFLVFYILPGYKEKYLDIMRNRMQLDNNMTPQQKELAFETTANHFTTIQIGFNLFMNLIAGTVGTVIAASLAKKKKLPASTRNE